MSRPLHVVLWCVGVLGSALLFFGQVREDPSHPLPELFGYEDPDLASGFVGFILPVLILAGCAFVSTTRKRLVVWCAGAVVATALFYMGIGRAVLGAWLTPAIGFGHPVWESDLWIGMLGPLLVLGVCAVLTKLTRKAR